MQSSRTQKDKRQDLKNLTHQKDLLYRDTFLTPAGKQVMADLETHFNPDRLATGDAHTTAVRVGGSEVIRYILRRITNVVDGKPT